MLFIINISRDILPKGPYLSCVSMLGRALLAGNPRYVMHVLLAFASGQPEVKFQTASQLIRFTMIIYIYDIAL